MGRIVGQVLTEKGRGIGSLLVTASAVTGNVGGSRRQRLAAVMTGLDGSFSFEPKLSSGSESGCAARWDLLVTVEAGTDKTDAPEVLRNLLARETREDASALETFRFVITDSRLKAAGVILPPEQQPEDLIARDRRARDVQKKFDDERLRRLGDSLRQAQAVREGHAEGFNTFLERLSLRRQRGANGYVPPEADIVQENLRVIRQMITQDLPRATAANHAEIDDSTLNSPW
jgi:hypothetical protein